VNLSTQATVEISVLVERFAALAAGTEVTIVYDPIKSLKIG